MDAALANGLFIRTAANTVEATCHWIAKSDLAQQQFTNSSHWPTVDQPNETARAIASFYGSI